MDWLIFNFLTVMATGLIIPSITRYIVLKRPLNKIASVLILVPNVVLIVMLWVFLSNAMFPHEVGGRTPTYLLLGVTLAMFTGWAILTKQETDSNIERS